MIVYNKEKLPHLALTRKNPLWGHKEKYLIRNYFKMFNYGDTKLGLVDKNAGNPLIVKLRPP